MRIAAAVVVGVLIVPFPANGATSPDSKNRSLTVINDTNSRSIRNVYYTQNRKNPWSSRDLLGSDTVGAGTNHRITVDDGTGACYFYLRFVLGDNSDVVSEELNVCTQTSYRIWDR